MTRLPDPTGLIGICVAWATMGFPLLLSVNEQLKRPARLSRRDQHEFMKSLTGIAIGAMLW